MMNITPFSPAERKALMEELFPLNAPRGTTTCARI